MNVQDSWIRAEMGGTKQASVITKPEILIALLKKAKRPLIIIGHEIISDRVRTDILIRMVSEFQKTKGIPILTTSHIAGQVMERGIRLSGVLGSMEIIDRLRDPTWNGCDGNGQYDLVFIAGFSYALGSLLFSALKQNAPQTKVISLDPKYHPHATWSYANMKTDSWKAEIDRLIDLLHSENTHQKMEEIHV
jgi:acetyl-CoA decarbonylase/synthase complex subunit epsilon